MALWAVVLCSQTYESIDRGVSQAVLEALKFAKAQINADKWTVDEPVDAFVEVVVEVHPERGIGTTGDNIPLMGLSVVPIRVRLAAQGKLGLLAEAPPKLPPRRHAPPGRTTGGPPIATHI